MNFQEKLEWIQRIHKGDTISEVIKNYKKKSYIVSDITKIKSDFKNKKIMIYFNHGVGIEFEVNDEILSEYLKNLFYINTLKNIYNELKSNIDVEICFDKKTEIELNLF